MKPQKIGDTFEVDGETYIVAEQVSRKYPCSECDIWDKCRARDLQFCKMMKCIFKKIKENNALRMVAIKPGSVIEQCTGIKDQSGKLIFEGDVVDYYDPMADDHYQGVVTFDDNEDTASGYYIKGNRKGRWDSYLDGSHCWIIGNVHQMEEAK